MHQTLGLRAPFVPAPSPASMRTADSLPVEAIVQYMAGLDVDFFRGVGDYTTFIQTHLMPPLTGVCAGYAAGAALAGETAHAAKADIGGAPPTVHVAGWPAIPTTIPCWWPNGMVYQILIEPPEVEHGYVMALGTLQVWTALYILHLTFFFFGY